MRETMNMTKKELAVFALMAVLSGFMIGIGGTASLLANHLLGVWGRLIGAVLFSLGIYAIVTYGMKLFTGMVADIPKMGMKNMWRLPLCFFGNVIGVGIVAVVFLMLPVLLQLWLFRLCLLSAGGMAQILSCQRLASLYRDSAALVGALMAATALVDAVLIFEFALIFSI